MKPFIRSAAALLLATGLSAQAAPRSLDWPQLRERADGKQAVVRLQGGEALEGRVSAAPDALSIGGRTIACAEIAEVEIRKKSRRAMWAVIGGAAGLAAGALLGTRFSNEGNDGAAAGLAGGLAAAGAGIGYAAGGGKRETLTLAPGSCPL